MITEAGETPQQFEDRINKFFAGLKDYTVEFEAFNEGSGLYFVRYVVTETADYTLRWRYYYEILKKKVTGIDEQSNDPAK